MSLRRVHAPDVWQRPRAPWTSGRDPPAPENAALVARLPRISDAACRSPEEGIVQARTASEYAQLLRCENQAARGTPEEEAQTATVGRRGPFRPSPEVPVEALIEMPKAPQGIYYRN